MSAVSSVGSGVSAQQIAAQRPASTSKPSVANQAEEQAESPGQEAAENEGGGLNILA